VSALALSRPPGFDPAGFRRVSTMSETFKVKFFDAKASRKGAGVRVAYFADRAEAEAFAASNQLYAKPCKVETLAPLSAEQLRAVAS
jgi:hypothetical protein